MEVSSVEIEVSSEGGRPSYRRLRGKRRFSAAETAFLRQTRQRRLSIGSKEELTGILRKTVMREGEVRIPVVVELDQDKGEETEKPRSRPPLKLRIFTKGKPKEVPAPQPAIVSTTSALNNEEKIQKISPNEGEGELSEPSEVRLFRCLRKAKTHNRMVMESYEADSDIEDNFFSLITIESRFKNSTSGELPMLKERLKMWMFFNMLRKQLNRGLCIQPYIKKHNSLEVHTQRVKAAGAVRIDDLLKVSSMFNAQQG